MTYSNEGVFTLTNDKDEPLRVELLIDYEALIKEMSRKLRTENWRTKKRPKKATRMRGAIVLKVVK